MFLWIDCGHLTADLSWLTLATNSQLILAGRFSSELWDQPAQFIVSTMSSREGNDSIGELYLLGIIYYLLFSSWMIS